jgi:fructose-bisphosphate aldolase class II
MKTLRQIIDGNLQAGTAVGHFNIPNLEVAQAIVDAAVAQNVPVVFGLSEGERKYIGLSQVVSWVKSVNQDLQNKNLNTQVFLNADHTYSFELVKEAVEAGFDMVIYDDAKGNIEDNINVAKKCREFIDKYNKENSKDVLFEAEIGYIGSGSEVRTELPSGIQKTSVETATHFVQEVRPDLLAPAVGNVHGMLKDVPEPNLDEKLCGEIYTATKVPLVLHGASGNTKEDVQACIKNGVAMVHVSTEIRVAYKNALKEAVNNGDDLAAYKYLKPVRDAVQKLIEEKISMISFKN